ncbi:MULTISPECIES: DUF2164 domain-containing protein [Priestia]|jgi:uncharacterized protein (DUF2164 family)|uniref:DUF2164 domain-containing protein n=1 Tax=Priestia TaxID=2800373 RepID=UPI0020411968|nr:MULTISPECIES: DUF2164 domain-containing protein [Priestia]MCM3772553.1 DUF2164 domain-containing protein [Priestia aryabhattai]MDY0939747.1 DUF2164 domain-containing protein [Priestia megaterium]
MFINFSKEDKDKMLDEIQTFFYNERDEEISEFAAENVLEFIKEHIGPYFYNQAIKDAEDIMNQVMLSAEENLHALKKPVEK